MSRKALTLTRFNWLITLWRVIDFHVKKTFLLITRARFKILIFCVFEIEERLVMFNLALKNVFAKN